MASAVLIAGRSVADTWKAPFPAPMSTKPELREGVGAVAPASAGGKAARSHKFQASLTMYQDDRGSVPPRL
jgi:hypothetical protein